jgi:hypothetical protein
MNALLSRSPNLYHAAAEDFVDTAPAELVPQDLPQPQQTPPLVTALRDDAARMFEQLGLKSVRAAIVDLASMQIDPVWGMTDEGGDADAGTAVAVESQFPGAEGSLAQLRSESGEITVTRRLSPRHWALAWRLHQGQAVVAEVRYHDARTLLCDIDTTLVRLMCNSGAQAALASREQDRAAAMAAPVPASGERRRRQQDMRLPRRAAFVLSVLSAVLAAWLATMASGVMVDPSDHEPLRVAALTLGAAAIGVALLLAWQGRRTRRAGD